MHILFHLLLLFSFTITLCYGEIPNHKFEYKYSFKPPYLAQQDGSVPFWKYGGNAIASADNIRITPSLKSQKGAIWSTYQTNFDWWVVDFVFRVSGRGRIGADGLAFWFTATPGDFDGPVFGSSDKWVGLGVFFDSFDNDNKHNNPYIMAVVNDGTKVYDHANDGTTQMLNGCLRDFRNKPFSTRARIEYFKNTLTVLFHNGNTQNENDYELCIRVENVYLPKYGHFGISAATGGLADDHDVKQFLTHSLIAPGVSVPPTPGRVEEQKLSQEYEEYQRKLELQKEQYKKDHPESQKEDQNEFDDWFESDNQRELRQIFASQNQMYELVRVVSNKMDELIGRQERALSILSVVQSAGGIGGAGVPPSPQQIHGTASGQPVMQRHEVDGMLAMQKDLMHSTIEIRNQVVETARKMDNVMQMQAKQPTAQVQAVGYDTNAILRELQESIGAIHRDVVNVAQKVNAAGGLCPSSNCLNTTTFLVFFAIQAVILVGYILYRRGKDNNAKKFF